MPGRTLSNKQVMESIRLIGFTHESRHRGNDGAILRSWPGGPLQGTSLGKVLKIEPEQDGKVLPVEIDYDRQIWSGLSWGAGEIKLKDILSEHAITIRCLSAEKSAVTLDGRLFNVVY